MPSAPERQRAYRLRAHLRRGDTLEPEDAAWLGDYEKAASNGSFGASASERTVHVEERQMAVGAGSEAAAIAATASLAREEGRRLDYLTKAGIDALVAAAAQSREAAALYGLMVKDLLSRTRALEEVHLAMLDSVRENYLARTQAEVDAMQAQQSKTGAEEMLMGLLTARLGGEPKPVKK